MLVSYCIQSRFSVEADGIDHEGVAIPGPDGIPEPGRVEMIWIRMFPAHGDCMEPGVLLKKKPDIVLGLQDLDRIGRIERTEIAEGEATARIVTINTRIVLLEFVQRGRQVRKRSRSFL